MMTKKGNESGKRVAVMLTGVTAQFAKAIRT
jgi:hypothetical protein